MKIIVLGGGLVGAPMAIDLQKDKKFDVTVADHNNEVLNGIKAKCPQISIVHKDLSEQEGVITLVRDYDMVINAVPGFLGFNTAKAIIKAGRNSVCIAFYGEDPFELDQLAKDNKVTMIMDCGVFPGMGSALIMDVTRKLDEVESVLIYVGGLPEIREWPSDYKAVFSPIDVIEEYTRPARFIENGREVVRPALSDPEFVFFPRIGTLEAFNTDGLRTLIKTIKVPNLKEKTLRYPGHIEKMAILRELGFFSKKESLEIHGKRVSPLEMTGQVLFPNWTLKKGESDITIFEALIAGEKDGKRIKYKIDLFDRYDPQTEVISMARTTGYTATMALRMIADGLYTTKGISPPEYMGRQSKCIGFLLNGLKERGVNWEIKEELI